MMRSVTMSKSERAVEFLSGADPQFQALCDLLYGPEVDYDAIWGDVYGSTRIAKMGDTTKHLMETAGLGATLIGAGLGAREVGAGVTGMGGAVGRGLGKITEGAGKLLPTGVKQALSKPAVRAGVAGSMLAGDVAESKLAVDRNANSKQVRRGLVPVNKSVMSEAKVLASGLIHGAKKLEHFDPTTPMARSGRGTLQSTEHAPSYRGRHEATPASSGKLPATKITPVPKQSGDSQLSMFHADGRPGEGALPGSDAVAQNAGAMRSQDRAGKLVQVRARPYESAKAGLQRAGQAVSATPGRAVATAGAVGVAGAAYGHHKGRSNGIDPYAGYAKRDEPTTDFLAQGTFSKLDNDKRLAFGWASVVEKNGLPVVDRQGDYISAEDMEEAAYRYVLSSRIGGDMHKRVGASPHQVSDMVESIVFTPDKCEAMGISKSMAGRWWVGFKIHDEDTWQLVKKGQRAGFSIHGRGKRVLTDMDELVGA